MNKTIVTSLFNIDNNFKAYAEKFDKLALLDNEMFVFTETKYHFRVTQIRAHRPTTIFDYNVANEADDLEGMIEIAQTTPTYIRLIGEQKFIDGKFKTPLAIKSTLLRPTMVCMASIQAQSDQLVYVDSEQDLDFVRKVISEDFDKDHIHIFSLQEYTKDITIHRIIADNLRFIDGGIVVATKELWRQLEFLILEGSRSLLESYLIDDIDMMLLLASLADPKIFKIHKK